MLIPENYRGTNLKVFDTAVHLSPEDMLVQNNFKALADLMLSLPESGAQYVAGVNAVATDTTSPAIAVTTGTAAQVSVNKFNAGYDAGIAGKVSDALVTGIDSSSPSDVLPALSTVSAAFNTLVATGQTIDCTLLGTFTNFGNLVLTGCTLSNVTFPTLAIYFGANSEAYFAQIGFQNCNLTSLSPTTDGINVVLLGLFGQWGLAGETEYWPNSPVNLQGNQWPQGSFTNPTTGFGVLGQIGMGGAAFLLTPNDLNPSGQTVTLTDIYTDGFGSSQGVSGLPYDGAFKFTVLPSGGTLSANDYGALYEAILTVSSDLNLFGTIYYGDNFALDSSGWSYNGGIATPWIGTPPDHSFTIVYTAAN